MLGDDEGIFRRTRCLGIDVLPLEVRRVNLHARVARVEPVRMRGSRLGRTPASQRADERRATQQNELSVSPTARAAQEHTRHNYSTRRSTAVPTYQVGCNAAKRRNERPGVVAVASWQRKET